MTLEDAKDSEFEKVKVIKGIPKTFDLTHAKGWIDLIDYRIAEALRNYDKTTKKD